jgi:CRP-like cAMP-binding protein
VKPVTAPALHNSPLSSRLSRLVQLRPAELQALQAAERNMRRAPAKRELLIEGAPIRHGRALLSGWACHQHILLDGQRQILSFLLPGDLIGVCRHSRPVASTTIVAITEVTTCVVPEAQPGSGLAEAYAHSAALEQHYLLAEITRLGRLNAYERLADWFLETHERLAFNGLAGVDQFALPLTQEMLADALGLTSVHVSRTLQALRCDGLLELQGGVAMFPRRSELEALIGYKRARVTADAG